MPVAPRTLAFKLVTAKSYNPTLLPRKPPELNNGAGFSLLLKEIFLQKVR